MHNFNKFKQKNELTHKYIIWIILSFCLASLFVEVVMESLHRGSIFDVYTWVKSSTYEFLINFLLVSVIILLFQSLIGNLYLSTAFVSSFLLFIVLISKIKMSQLGVPLLPWDIFISNEGTDILKYFWNGKIVADIVIVIVIVLLVLSLYFITPKIKLNSIIIAARITLAIASIGILFYLLSANKTILAEKLGITQYIFEQDYNYEKNGILLAFLLNTEYLSIQKPEEYTKQKVQTILVDTGNKNNKLSDTKPNVIVIMNEAFWDPYQLGNVSFNEDLISNIRKYSENNYYGKLLVSQFGGGTSNVEFEVLTGNSMKFLPVGSVPYQQYINEPMVSLASIFKQNGYVTTAVHPYHSWYWNRIKVYQYFGFDKFISSEIMIYPEYKGPFISDMEVTNRILDEIKREDAPIFLFAVTMQNHGPYEKNRYNNMNIRLENSNFSSEAKEILETYAQGIYDADQALGTLIEEIEQIGEPTVVIFFGDHLPVLGDNYKVYLEANYIRSPNMNQWSLEERVKMYTTPLLIWANTDTNMHLLDEEPIIGASFLGAKILDVVGIEKNQHLQFNNFLSQQIAGMTNMVTVYQNGQLSLKPPQHMNELIENYKILQYDNLFGEKYGFNDMLPIMGEGLHSHQILLREVIPAEVTAGVIFSPFNGQASLAVIGNGFLPNSTIYLDNHPLETSYGSEELLTALVPPRLYKKSGKLKVTVKVFDSKNVLILESNAIDFIVH